jgi:hypothetical protein
MEIIRNSTYINDDVLTSFETWTICDEVGYIPEDFISNREAPYEEEITTKPDSLKLIENNSAYLAIKYTKQIENELLDSSDLVLVFPDETTNQRELEKRAGKKIQLEETPSGYFAETLMQLKEIEYFGVPREILDRITFNKGEEIPDLSFIQNEYKDFFQKLRLLPDEIIIMDEFGFSGGTLEKIVAILIHVAKKKPKAYFPIFNFNPKKINSITKPDYKVLSLYDINIKSK